MTQRNYTLLDQIIVKMDHALSTMLGNVPTQRDYPAAAVSDHELSEQEKKQAAALMRVNHSGEVCAQALYESQLLIARNQQTRSMLQHACEEELDHLNWTHRRLIELGSHRSALNLCWYVNSFVIGLLAGAAGDQWSLGFVEETERQVSEHLKSHLGKLPTNDQRSRAIVLQMKKDEEEHGANAANAGGQPLPVFMQTLMRCHAKAMTTLSYWV